MLDVSASYPSNGDACNTSKKTTVREIMDIIGIPEHVFRAQNMGISAGHVNAVEYCTTMLGMPNHLEMLELFEKRNVETNSPIYENATA